MSHFLLAMMLYPDVQRRAQAELNSVLGVAPGRMPTFADRERLPYSEMSSHLLYSKPDLKLSTVQAIV